jgi:hypothetical protein
MRSAIVLALFCLTQPAWAYIPASQFIVKSISSKRAGNKAFRVRTTVYEMEGQRTGSTSFKQVTIFDLNTRTMRSRAYDMNGKELYAMERRFQESASVVGGMPVASLLLDPSVDSVSRVLRSAGIPVRVEAELADMKDEEERRASEVTSLGRLGSTVAWVIGPGKKDLGWPQLWIEKDTFQPLRMIERTDEGTMDIRFAEFRYFKEIPFPRVITVMGASREEGTQEPKLREELADFIVNPEMGEMRSPLVQGYTDAGNSADGSVRDLIRLYYSSLR